MSELVLVHSPLVGAFTWMPTARTLEARGAVVHVPSLASDDGSIPNWCQCTAKLQTLLAGVHRPVLVGHSAAGILVADLAARFSASALIFVDAQIPPDSGNVAPADGWFLDFVRNLKVEDGRLPPWSTWWGPTAISSRITDPVTLALFEAGLPRLSPDWFDDSIDLAPWAHIPTGYIRTSAIFDGAADKAAQRSWPVIRLEGTHLHTMLAPEQTADAISAIMPQLAGPLPEA